MFAEVLAEAGGGPVTRGNGQEERQNNELQGEVVATSTESVDTSGWQTYRNEEYGFEFKYPKEIIPHYPYYSCSAAREQFIGSSLVPIKIFEDENGIFIEQAYWYRIVDNECQKINNFLSLIKKEGSMGWHIIFKKVNSEKELDTFIKLQYGSDCSFKEKKPTNQENTYLVDFDRGGTGYNVDCIGGVAITIIYNPSVNKAVTWIAGVDYAYCGADNQCFDTEMTNSFKFID